MNVGQRCQRCSELHRKLQKAEGELQRLRRKLGSSSSMRGRVMKAAKRDDMADVIERAGLAERARNNNP
jgi:hypothetical protein